MCSNECRALIAQLNDLLDKDALTHVTPACLNHLRSCRRCACLVRTVRKTIELYRSFDPPPIPAGLHSQIWAVLARHRD
jgi:hypothetical protein